MKSLILTISCSDKPGIVAEVTKFLFKNGFNILESGQFNDKYTDNFFMRTEFQLHDKKKLFDDLMNEIKEYKATTIQGATSLKPTYSQPDSTSI